MRFTKRETLYSCTLCYTRPCLKNNKNITQLKEVTAVQRNEAECGAHPETLGGRQGVARCAERLKGGCLPGGIQSAAVERGLPVRLPSRQAFLLTHSLP